MWPLWLSSPRRRKTQTTTSQPPSRSHSCHFSRSSLKDIQTLLQPEPEPESPKSPSFFRRLHISPSLIRSLNNNTQAIPTPSSYPVAFPPYFDHSTIVLYHTTLRVIRRTFEDCRVVRSILQGFGVMIDERDVSIDDRFRDELTEMLGRRNVMLPCVFIGGEYIGGVDDVKRLYNSGELQGLIERLPRSKVSKCDLCGGMRFIVCGECDGSHKVFTEKSGFGIRKCSSCNANGLIRCPACFFVLPRHTN